MASQTGGGNGLAGVDGVALDPARPSAPVVPEGREHAIQASERADGCFGLQSHYLALQAIHDALTHGLEQEAARYLTRRGTAQRGRSKRTEALLNQRAGVVMFLKAIEGGSLHLWPPYLREALERIDWRTQRYRHPKVDEVGRHQGVRFRAGQRVRLPTGCGATIVDGYAGLGPDGQCVYTVRLDEPDNWGCWATSYVEDELAPEGELVVGSRP